MTAPNHPNARNAGRSGAAIHFLRRVVEAPWTPALVLLGPLFLLWPWITARLDFQASMLSTDDSFYYYAFARNVAAGLGPTVDGDVITNGVQPLWAAILVVLAAVVPGGTDLGSNALVTAALITCALLLVAAGFLWSLVARRLGDVWFAWVFVVVWVRVMVTHQWALLTGMEIALDVALAGALVLVLIDLRDRGWRHPVIGPLAMGSLLAAFLLGRLDHVVLFVLPVGIELGLRATGRGLLPAVRWHHLGLMAIPSLLLFTPYLVWNRTTFGHWLPVSGAIKLWHHRQALDATDVDFVDRTIETGTAVWENVARPVGWTMQSLTGAAAWNEVAGFLLAIALALVIVLTPREHRRHALVIVVLAMAALIPRAWLHAQRLGERDLSYAVWYLTLAWPVGVLVVSQGLWRGLGAIPRWRGSGSVLRASVLACLIVPFLVEWDDRLEWEVEHADLDWRAPMAKVDALRWAEENLPPDAVLGSFNSGVLHWYASDRKVLNLDGRVDDGGLLATLEAGGSSLDYVRERGVTHLIDTQWDDGLWRRLVDQGEVLHERPYGPRGASRMVVVTIPYDDPSR